MPAIEAASHRAAAACRIGRRAARLIAVQGTRANETSRGSKVPSTRCARMGVRAKALMPTRAVVARRRRTARASCRARPDRTKRNALEVQASRKARMARVKRAHRVDRVKRRIRAVFPQQRPRPSDSSPKPLYLRAVRSCRLAVPIWRSVVGTAAISCSCAAMRMSTIPRSAWPSSRACLRPTTIRWV